MTDNPKPRQFTIYGPQNHAEPVPPMEWLIKNVWPANSHGPLAGPKKSFKSYNAQAMAVSTGSGLAYLGQYPVHRQGNVFYLVGEGGYTSWRRRYQRMCAAYGVKPDDANVYATTDICAVDSTDFADIIGYAKEQLKPTLIILDPLYAYHPKNIEAQNLYDRGRMLANLSKLVGEETALIIPDHYRKSGSEKLDLDEIGQSGMAQWADSWILQTHRKPYDFTTGTAYLNVEFGSREGYGRRRSIDLTVGTFNEDTGDHEGEISWIVKPYQDNSSNAGGAEIHNEKTLHARLSALLDNPAYEIEKNRTFTKTVGISMLQDIFQIKKSAAYARWNQLIKNGTIVETQLANRFRIGALKEEKS